MNGQKKTTAALKRNLTFFGFLSITVSMVIALYEYPTFATSNLSLLFFLLLGGFLWFIPVALCAAEMATVDGWQEGGVFTWVSQTLGKRWGLAAIFFQWFEITVGYLTMLYFLTGAITYATGIDVIQSNPVIKLIVLLVIFWIILFSQLFGTKYTSGIARIGFIFGIVLPALTLFGLGIAYVASGGPIQPTLFEGGIIPDFSKLPTLVVFVSFILAFMGVETSASHANEMENPKRDYPLAMLVLVILAIVLDALGGLTVAATVPQQGLSLNTGVIQSLEYLIGHFAPTLTWIARILAVLLCLGVIGEIASWITSPSRALNVAAKQGLLPSVFAKVNKHGAPAPLLIVHGLVATLWAVIFTLTGGGNNLSFLAAMSLCVVIYLLLYFLFFIGYLVLIYKKADLKRAYEIPGGKVGKTIVAVAGLITSVFAFVISFVPPSTLLAGQDNTYLMILIIPFIIVAIIPFVIYAFRHKYKQPSTTADTDTTNNVSQ